jgi:hypothetical protein
MRHLHLDLTVTAFAFENLRLRSPTFSNIHVGADEFDEIARWRLPPDHPITAPGFLARRPPLAKAFGLGRALAPEQGQCDGDRLECEVRSRLAAGGSRIRTAGPTCD